MTNKKNNKINIKELKKEVQNLYKKKYNNILNNYKELYKNYSNIEIIKDNNLNEISFKLNKLEEQYKNKEYHIYIYFQWLSLINYEKENLKSHYIEITEENYNYFLEVLPPLKMNSKGFYMQEFLTENLTNYYYIENNKYYVTVKEFNFNIEGVL